MTDTRLLTPSQVRLRTGLSNRALEAMRKRGEGPEWHRFGPKRIRYDAAALEQYLASTRCAPATPTSREPDSGTADKTETALDAHIREVVAAAPALTTEQKWRLMTLLVETPGARGDVA